MYLRIILQQLVLAAQHRTHPIIGSLVTIRRNGSLLKRDNSSRTANELILSGSKLASGTSDIGQSMGITCSMH